MKKPLALFLLLIVTTVNAGNKWDLADCNEKFPNKVFADKINGGVTVVAKPSYMDIFHNTLDSGAITVPKEFSTIFQKIHHKDCQTFDAFLAFVFLCSELTYDQVEQTKVLDNSFVDKLIRNIALTGSHGAHGFWLDNLNPNLLPGAQVIWLSDEHKEEPAKIKWIGPINSIGSAPFNRFSLYLGLEFDNPVGKGIGCNNAKGELLFTTKKDHAGVLPLMSVYSSNGTLPSDKVAANQQLANQDMASLASTQGRSLRPDCTEATRSDILGQQLREQGSVLDSDTRIVDYASLPQ